MLLVEMQEKKRAFFPESNDWIKESDGKKPVRFN